MLLEEKQRFSTASRFTTVSTISDLEPDYSGDKGRLEGRAGDRKRAWAWSWLFKEMGAWEDCQGREKKER